MSCNCNNEDQCQSCSVEKMLNQPIIITPQPIDEMLKNIDSLLIKDLIVSIGNKKALECFISVLNRYEDEDEDDYDINLRCAIQDAYDEYLGKYEGEIDGNTKD